MFLPPTEFDDMRNSLVLVIAGGVLLAGCSSGCGDDAGPPAVTSTPTPTSAAQVRYPLDAYEPTAEQDATLQKAELAVAADCMGQFGFTGAVKIPRMSVAQFEQRNRSSVLDERVAGRYGYQRFESTAGPGISEPETDGGSGELSGKVSVLFGQVSEYQGKPVPSGGCAGEAQRRLLHGVVWPDGMKADIRSVETFVNGLQWEALKSAEADKRMQQATERWSNCMRSSGYDYRRPDDAIDDPRWANTDKVVEVEIQTAVADVRCQKRVNYVGVRSSLLKAYGKRLVEKHAEALDEVKKLVEKRLQNAASVINAKPAP